MIRVGAAKQACTSEPATESRAAKRARTSEPARATPSFSIDKGNKVMEHLSSALDNELLNAAKVTVESTSASVAKMLCKRMFGGPGRF